MDRTFYLPSLGRGSVAGDQSGRPQTQDVNGMAELRNRMLQELQMFLSVELAGRRNMASSRGGRRTAARAAGLAG